MWFIWVVLMLSGMIIAANSVKIREEENWTRGYLIGLVGCAFLVVGALMLLLETSPTPPIS